MATNLDSSSAANNPPDPEQVSTQINSAFSGADAGAIDASGNLQLVHQDRVSRFTRTAASLESRYGATDPRVVSAQEAVNAGMASVARISMTNQQIATPAPTVPTGGWVLHGRVFNARLQPAAKHSVFLVDEQNAYQKQYGFVYTDDTGYFQISYSAPAGTSQPPVATKLFIQVTNPKTEPVYLGASAFQPSVNRASYQNVTLPGGPIGRPPAGARSSALPTTKK